MLRKYLDRQYIGFIVSLIAMNIVVLLFRDMFLFSKGGHHLPSWIKDLPHYLMPPWIFVWCLIPVVFFPNTEVKKLLQFGFVITISPVFAVIAYFIESFLWDGDFINALLNSMFNYFCILIMIVINLLVHIKFFVGAILLLFIVRNKLYLWSGIEDFLDHFEKKK